MTGHITKQGSEWLRRVLGQCAMGAIKARNSQLGLFYLRAKDDEEGPRIKPAICPRCREMNAPDAQHCKKCGLVLDIALAMKSQEQELTYAERLDQLEKLMKVIIETGVVDWVRVGTDQDKRIRDLMKRQGMEPREPLDYLKRWAEQKGFDLVEASRGISDVVPKTTAQGP